MKDRSIRKLLTVAVLFIIPFASNAQGFNSLLHDAAKRSGVTIPGDAKGSLTNTEIINGLKQALQVGTQNSAQRLAAVNGYFGNQLIKITMPPEAQKVESALRNVGMGDKVDQAILSMNRAAEDAATKAVPIFTNAITSMSIQDGLSILKGDKNAATNYLRSKTYGALTNTYKPEIKKSLDKVDATKYWNDVFTAYNKIPFVEKVNPDLVGYVTEKALNGLFTSIAQEEANIRNNPEARVTDLLKKVFGAK